MDKLRLYEDRFHTLIFACLSFLVAFSTDIGSRLTDTFHEGEFVGFLWHMRDYYNGNADFPLYVHGGMDYIPALIASFIFGDDFIVIGTRIILVAITAISFFLFMDICKTLIAKNENRFFWFILICFLFYYFSPPLKSEAVEMVSFPVREVFLLLTIWSFAKHGHAVSRASSIIFVVIGSSSAVLGVFWCYNRGLMAILFSLFVVYGFFYKKKTSSLIVFAVSVLVCLAILEHTNILGTISENFENIKYWAKYGSGISRYPFEFVHIPGYFGLLLLLCFVLSVIFLIIYVFPHINKDDNPDIFIISGLIAVQLLLLFSIYDRADLDRSFYGGWPAIILMFYVASRLVSINTDAINLKIKFTDNLPALSKKRSQVMFVCSLVALAVFMILASPKILLSYPRFLKYSISMTPDSEIVPRDIYHVGTFMAEQNISCYVNLTDEGVIALIARKKFCTDFPYGYYISKNHEKKMLDQLMIEAPGAIVFHREIPEYEDINKKYPLISGYIDEYYHDKLNIGIYKIYIKKP